MSIIERYSPLNLAYKVFIVTNASSPAGVIVCNTLMKANALVLGTDDKPKDDSLTAATYTHFQFHKCKLADESSVADILADAKQKFKVDRVDGLVNLASEDDDTKTQDAHKKLAAACAKVMKAADGGAVVNTLLQAANTDGKERQAIDQLADKSTDQCYKANDFRGILAESNPPRAQQMLINTLGDKENLKSCQQYEEAKKHLGFLFKPPGNPNGKSAEKAPSEERNKMFEFSNTVLFLSSGMSEGLNGVVLNPDGQLVQS